MRSCACRGALRSRWSGRAHAPRAPMHVLMRTVVTATKTHTPPLLSSSPGSTASTDAILLAARQPHSVWLGVPSDATCGSTTQGERGALVPHPTKYNNNVQAACSAVRRCIGLKQRGRRCGGIARRLPAGSMHAANQCSPGMRCERCFAPLLSPRSDPQAAAHQQHDDA